MPEFAPGLVPVWCVSGACSNKWISAFCQKIGSGGLCSGAMFSGSLNPGINKKADGLAISLDNVVLLS